MRDAKARADYQGGLGASPGSLYGSGGRLSDLVRDQRAYQLDDLVTVVISDRASAVTRGSTSTARNSTTKGSISALAGSLAAAGRLANLANLNGASKLDGKGQTSRESELSTSLSARIVAVLPNGNLVIEGSKDVQVNSERQVVTVRGVCRPQDLSVANTIRSEQLAFLEVRINGRGVVGDAVRRPFFLYRLLTGLLPF
ncbi:MAG: flagellar basal body L-ring protein FlgH [Bryobacteraceae bacterium]|nr:flagellar basal body L-ring protein FlgH [Bryobacteraceae bacterium]MDW8380058.1 flagellar basal body L-ring protein FlgH [Bryobacterales bacterium]